MRTRAVDSREVEARLAELEPVVLLLVGGFAKRIPPHVDLDDLAAAARIAAWQTARAHGHLTGEHFTRMAYTRIRGAIWDELRRQAPGSRWNRGLRPRERPRFVQLAPWHTNHLVEAAPKPELIDALRHAWRKLSPRERRIVTWVHVDGLLKQDVAKRFGIHESRVSQLYASAMRTIRKALDAAV